MVSWGGDNTGDSEAKDLFDQSDLKKEDGNTFVLLLNPEGKFVHGFRAYSTGRRNPTYVTDELQKGLSLMKLPPPELKWAESYDELQLPDVRGDERPAGVRLFIRPVGDKISKSLIVEAVPMTADQRTGLRYPKQTLEIDATLLRSWLVQLYPAAIREAEQQKSFKKVEGSLQLKPAGANPKVRYAILSGPLRMTSEAGDSSVDATLQSVLTYDSESGDFRSLRGFVEGTFHYLVHGRPVGEGKIAAAIESRPE